MKRKQIVSAVLASTLLFPACAGSVCAYENDALMMPSEFQEMAKEQLSMMAAEQADSQTYSLRMDDDMADFSGYDVSSAYTVYTTTMYLKDNYKKDETIASMLSGSPAYVIPYENENCRGDIWMYADEQGGMNFYKRTVDAETSFHLDEVTAAVSQLDNVQDVKLVQDGMFHMNLVYVVTDEEEYIIPNAYGMSAQRYSEDLTFGAVYKASEFMSWVENAFLWKENTNAATDVTEYTYGDGVPTYVGYTVTPIKVDGFEISESGVLAGISVLAFAAAGGLTIYGIVNLKRKPKVTA